MSYKPTSLDMAADLRRCIYASLSEEGFEDVNAKEFLKHALMIFRELEQTMDSQTVKIIKKQLERAQTLKLNPQKKRESFNGRSSSLGFKQATVQICGNNHCLLQINHFCSGQRHKMAHYK